MALDHYVTLGRSGLRVSPFCLGTMTFGEDLGWGSDRRGVAEDPRPLHRARRQLHRHRQRLHQGPLREDHRRPRRPPPSRRDRLVIATKFIANLVSRRSQRRRLQPQVDRRRLRAVAAAAADRLHRSLLAARLGQAHADRGDDGGARRSRARRQGPLHRLLRHAGLEVAQAQTIAQFRGWSPFIALQIEYSLLERTVEGELIPMALELGLGVTPWSPLRSGVLSGKYTRAERGDGQGRPQRVRRPAISARRRTTSSTSSERIAKAARHHGGARRAGLGAGASRA